MKTLRKIKRRNALHWLEQKRRRRRQTWRAPKITALWLEYGATWTGSWDVGGTFDFKLGERAASDMEIWVKRTGVDADFYLFGTFIISGNTFRLPHLIVDPPDFTPFNVQVKLRYNNYTDAPGEFSRVKEVTNRSLAPSIRGFYPSKIRWDWPYPNPHKWWFLMSMDGGETLFQVSDYWMNGDDRQFAPDGGGELYYMVGKDGAGNEITARSNIVRPDDAVQVPSLRAAWPALLQWDWEEPNPYQWNVWMSLDQGVSWLLDSEYWRYGNDRQFAPDGGHQLYYIVGVNAAGEEITPHSNVVRPDDAPPPGITSLSDVTGLLAEYRVDPVSCPVEADDTCLSWMAAAGSQAWTVNAVGENGTPPIPPTYLADYYSYGKSALQFNNGKMTAAVELQVSGLTCAWVGRVTAAGLLAPYPRMISVANYGNEVEDWNDPATWVCMCYTEGALVADRDYARPLSIPMDPDVDYVIVTRKWGSTITAWVRPLEGGPTLSASGETSWAMLNGDTLNIGGNNEPQNFNGIMAHVALWGRGLEPYEVNQVMDYLQQRYEP